MNKAKLKAQSGGPKQRWITPIVQIATPDFRKERREAAETSSSSLILLEPSVARYIVAARKSSLQG